MKRFVLYSVSLALFVSLATGAARAAAGDDAKKQAAEGQQIFVQRCMLCHSVNKDQVMTGPSLWSEMSHSPHKKTPAEIRVILRDGKGKMPSMKNVLAPDQVDDILAYLHSL